MSSIGNKQIFGNNLAYYVEKSGRSQRELAEMLGVASSTFNDWVKGRKYPRIDKVEMLANIFGILKSDLIEERSEEHREMQKKNDALSDIVIRMQTDNEFFAAVEALYKADKKKLSSVLNLLD